MSEEKTVGLSAPWITYYKMVYNLLSVDNEILVDEDVKDNEDGTYEFTIESSNEDKIISLSRILNDRVVFGNVTLITKFRCANDAVKFNIEIVHDAFPSIEDYDRAFSGNPFFVRTESIKDPTGASWDYAIFEAEIITFFNDDLTDYKQNAHYIVADIVKEISGETSVGVSTVYGEDTDLDEGV